VLRDAGLGLKQDVDTRWNSTLELLRSISKAMPELNELLKNHAKQKSNLRKLDVPLLQQLIKVLAPLEIATKLFSKAFVPTIHLKYVMKLQIIKDLDAMEKMYSLEEQDAEEDELPGYKELNKVP